MDSGQKKSFSQEVNYSRKHRFNLPRFFLVTESARFPDPLPLVEALPRDTGVVFRHYKHPDREGLAQEVALLCRKKRLPLLIGNDIGLALRLGARGIHLPQWQLGYGDALGRLKALHRPYWGFWITTSAHSVVALARLARMSVDGVFLSPVFATASHPEVPSLGVMRVASWSQKFGKCVSIYGLGGIDSVGRRRLTRCYLKGTAGTHWR